MSHYDYTANYFARHLERDIAAHEAGRFNEIGGGFDDAPDWRLDEKRDEIGAHRLGIAYNFWDQWIDARNHHWHYYPGVEEKDWPIIARQIVRGLREKWEPNRMRENAVFIPPPAPPRVSLWRRLRRALGRL